MEYIFDRITVDDGLCNGQPTIRGLRITVKTVLEFLLNDTPRDEILKQYPILEPEDLDACKKFALALMERGYKLKETAA